MSFVFVKGDFSTGAVQALGCIFQKTLTSPCHIDGELQIPSNLLKTFNGLPQSTQERLQNGELDSLTDMQFASLPVVFLGLLPVNRLSQLDASKLVRVIATHPGDVSLAYHMVSGVKTAQQKAVFMEKISRLNTSSAVQHVLAWATSHILNPLEQKDDHLRDIIHMPFLIHMPPRYLLQLNYSEVRQIFSNLPSDVEYGEVTPLETRIWALLSTNQQKKFDWLLTGFTEEDLTRISVTPDEFKTDFSIVQARVVFEKAYENKICNRINFVESILLLPKQTPSTLQKFPTSVHDYIDFTIFPPQSSLATSKQMVEYIIANCMETKKLGNDKYKWGQRIKYLKKWVYALPLSVLKQYSTQTVLSSEILYETQSKMLTERQAYYLTAQGESLSLSHPPSILKFTDNLLSALSTTKLLEHSIGSYSSIVLQHLLEHLPDKNVPRMVSLLVKTVDSFDSDEIFYRMLKNEAANSYFDLISSSNIRQSASSILTKLKEMEMLQMYSIDQLPSRILSVLLRAAKHDDMWTWQNFINSSQPLYMLMNGLNCDHVNKMETTDFITIIAYYNQQREMLKKVFPKNLQYCCLRKLIKYLNMKIELQQVDLDGGTITVLSPMEIEAVGGYVLLGLPTEVIEENKYKKLILASIGKLSIAELLAATDLTKLKEIAMLAVKYLFDPHFADYFKLGNLVWFVHPKKLPTSSTSTFMLAIEGQMLDKRLCLNTEERDAWSTILIQTFGVPESWSKGKLSTLGDLLLVFPEEVLQRVDETSWVDAADTLQSNYYNTVEWAQPIPFYKLCLMALGEKEGEAYLSAIKGLVRWRLRAAERQLNSVYKASNFQVKTKKLPSLEISPNGVIKQSNMVVKVYNPFHDEETKITVSAEINDSTESEEESSTEEGEETTSEYEEESSTETEQASTTEVGEESTIESKEESTTKDREEFTTEVKSTIESKEESTTKAREELTTEVKSTIESKEESTTKAREELATEVKSTIESKEESTTKAREELTTEVKSTTDIKGESTKISHIEALNNRTKETINDVTSTLEDSINEITSSKTTVDQTSETTTNTVTTEQIKSSDNENHTLTESSTKMMDIHLSSMTTNKDYKHNQTKENAHLSTVTEVSFAKTKIDNKTYAFIVQNQSDSERNIINFQNVVPEENKNVINEVNTKPTTINNNFTLSHTTGNTKYRETLPSNTSATVFPENIKEIKSTTAIFTNTTLKQDFTSSSDKSPSHIPVTNYVESRSTVSTPTNPSPSSYETSTTDSDNRKTTKEELVQDPNSTIFLEKRAKRSIVINWSAIKLFSCDALKMVGKIAALSLTSEDIDNMEQSELNDCGEVLGQFDFQEDVYSNIWGRLDEKDPIHLMGNLLESFTETDRMNIKTKFSEPWVLETISVLSQQITDESLVNSLIADLKWRNNDLNKINVETIAALSGFICNLDIMNTLSIWHNFHHVVVLLGRLPGCPKCLPDLAEIAVSQNGFGNIKQWEVEDVETLGSIVAGLNDSLWNDLVQSPNNLLLGIQPAAINCISTENLQAIPKDMVYSIPPLTLAMISKEKLDELSVEQKSAIQDVKSLKADFLSKKNIPIADSSCMHRLSFALTVLIITLYAFV